MPAGLVAHVHGVLAGGGDELGELDRDELRPRVEEELLIDVLQGIHPESEARAHRLGHAREEPFIARSPGFNS